MTALVLKFKHLTLPHLLNRGLSGGVKVLGKLSVPGHPLQGPVVLAVGVGGGCLDIF